MTPIVEGEYLYPSVPQRVLILKSGGVQFREVLIEFREVLICLSNVSDCKKALSNLQKNYSHNNVKLP